MKRWKEMAPWRAISSRRIDVAAVILDRGPLPSYYRTGRDPWPRRVCYDALGGAQLMLQVNSSKPLASVELALVQAAQRHGLNVLSIVHVGQLLQGRPWGPKKDAVVFTICRPDLSAALLDADLRFASFVPGRISALEVDGAVTLEAMTASEICGLLKRADLEELATPLESWLRMIMEEAAQPVAEGQAKPEARGFGPG